MMSKEWYDNIPEQGVLCWGQEFVSTPDDITYRRILVLVTERYKDKGWFLSRGTGKWYVNAVPLTNEEIEGFKR